MLFEPDGLDLTEGLEQRAGIGILVIAARNGGDGQCYRGPKARNPGHGQG